MEKKYWPGVISFALFMLMPIVMRHTPFKKYITTYVFTLLAIEILLFVVVLIVRGNRRKALH
jgi:hypothetical protein